MMHGAPNRIVHDEAVCEWRVIMGTEGTDRKIIRSAPHQNCVFAADAPLEHCAIRDLVDGNAAFEI